MNFLRPYRNTVLQVLHKNLAEPTVMLCFITSKNCTIKEQ